MDEGREHHIKKMPQDIELAECAIQTVDAKARYMFKTQMLENSFLKEAVANEVYIFN